jgi:hypothetical protein
MQVDKIYVAAKVISMSGVEEDYFLGACEPRERGAKGLLNAIESAYISTVGEKATSHIFQHTSSSVTDGASVNTGEKAGLWALFAAKCKAASPDQSMPLIKVWRCVHRSNLAWRSTSSSVCEVTFIFQQLVGLSTFFHSSGIRTRELKDVAEENNCDLLVLPVLFEIRWTEFNYNLLHAVLTSWQCLVLCMKKSNEKPAPGFLSFLLKKDNLSLLTFLADVLTIFSRYQKQLQADSITICDMDKLTCQVRARLTDLKERPLLGGWVEALEEQIITLDSGLQMLKGVELIPTMQNRRKSHHLYVPDHRNVESVCNEVVDFLVEFLQQRFEVDEEVMQIIKPFASLQSSANLQKVHKLLGSDLDAAEISLEYQDLLESENIDALRKMSMSELVRILSKSGSFASVTKIMARISAAKPHSSDVERLISTSIALKTSKRSSLSVETENEYLYVYHNMPPLMEWDPR